MPVTPQNSLSLNRRSFLRRSAFTATMAALGSSSLAGCGSDGGRLTFLSPIPIETLSLAPELLAVAGGHFAKHGLDVTLQPAKGTSQAMQAVLSGVAPVSRLGQIDVMTALTTTKQPLVNIATPFRTSAVRFVYSKKKHPVRRPADLIGQTMGVPSQGGNSDKVVSLVMAAAGLDPQDCERQVVGLTPGTFDLVQRGRLAGYVVSVDTANVLKAQDPDAGVFDPSKYAKSDAQVYATSKDALDKQADGLRAFLAAIQDAMAAMVADQYFGETIAQLRATYSFATLDDDQVARASLTMLREGWTGGDPSAPLLVTEKAAWAAGYKELTDAGMLDGGADPTSWFDNSLLPKS